MRYRVIFIILKALPLYDNGMIVRLALLDIHFSELHFRKHQHGCSQLIAQSLKVVRLG